MDYIEDYFAKTDFNELFKEEHRKIKNVCDKLKEKVSLTQTIVNDVLEKLEIDGKLIKVADESVEDDDDVLITDGNFEIFKNIDCDIGVGCKLYVKQNTWVHGKVMDLAYVPFEVVLSVMLEDPPYINVQVSGNQVAHFDAPTQANVGARVIAFNGSKAQWLSGLVADTPRDQNKSRYLIFFDDGSAQYCYLPEIRRIYEPKEPVWEDIGNKDMADFARIYLDLFPYIPIHQTYLGDRLKILKNGLWTMAEVKEVDSYMIKVQFDESGEVEWLYRGSRRLEVLHKNYDVYKKKSITARFSTGIRSKKSYKHYYIISEKDEEPDTEVIELDPCEPASTQESSTKHEALKENDEEMLIEVSSYSSIEQDLVKDSDEKGLTERRSSDRNDSDPCYSPPIATRIRKNQKKGHKCTPACLPFVTFCNDSCDTNVLQIPIKHHWQRKMQKTKKTHKLVVVYVSPCGLNLNNIEEVDNCLQLTNSPLSIDQFSFNPGLDVFREFILTEKKIEIKDYSLGREKVVVSCVNELTEETPPFLEYTTSRVPGVDVNIETSKEFLAGCDCSDGCRDWRKCRCIRLTRERVGKSRYGYSYRRLKKPLIQGIYECNSNCSCDSRCHNRVVQNGVYLRLQIFKTHKKGWGLRCLNDVPAGQFICSYIGHVMTNDLAEQQAEIFGDEYLADLDYIETVEMEKEGFEQEVVEDVDMVFKTSFSQPPISNTTAENTVGVRSLLNDDTMYTINTKHLGNLGRYINHSCDPNMFVQNVFIDTHDLRFPWVAFFSMKMIKAGTELTWDYGYSIDSIPTKKIPCYCGSANCTGRLL